jgi:hypothetical protein
VWLGQGADTHGSGGGERRQDFYSSVMLTSDL